MHHITFLTFTEKVLMKPSCDKAAVTKQSNSCDDPLASTADVESFVNKIIQKASHAVLVEVTH